MEDEEEEEEECSRFAPVHFWGKPTMWKQPEEADRVRLAALPERESELEIGRIRTAFGLHDPMYVWRHEAPPVKGECADPGAQPPVGAADADPHPREARGALCDGIARAATPGAARTVHGPAGSHTLQKKWHCQITGGATVSRRVAHRGAQCAE